MLVAEGSQAEKPMAAPAAALLPDPALPPETVLRPPRGWQLINVAELWHFRDLLYFLIWRDVKVRYKQTALGVAWAVLQPALMMVVFTIFFKRLADVPSGGLPYPIFVFAGLLPWMFFANGLAQGANSVVGSERLITKIYFPRLAVPFAAVGAAVVDLLVALALLLIMMLAYGIMPGWSVVMVPVILALLLLLTAGVATLFAALNVAYRDVRYIIPFLVQVWMFATPSIYMDLSTPTETQDSLLKTLLVLNPLTGLISSFRAATLGTPFPWDGLLYGAAFSVALFFAGCFYFRKVEDSFADVL